MLPGTIDMHQINSDLSFFFPSLPDRKIELSWNCKILVVLLIVCSIYGFDIVLKMPDFFKNKIDTEVRLVS